MSGANSTPLGKGHPAIGAVKKAPVNLGGSLLKPSYMSNAGSNGSVNSGASLLGPPAIQACSIGAAAAAAAKAAAALAINKRDRDPSPSRRGRDDERKRKRKSRWQGDEKEKIFIPGMPTVLPPNLSKDQEEAYLLQLQIEEISRRLRSNDLGIPANPDDRSPSPEPVYNNEGKRLNTRDYRTRKKLEDDRHSAITRMFDLNKDYKPPSDYKPPVVKVSDKVMIPQEEHPDINFVGLLIGPRGNTLKSMEKDTGAKIIIRGKGSVKEGKVGRKDGPMPGEDEPLHAFVSGTNIESVKKAVDKIKEIIRQGVEVPEGQNDLRRMQLRELALLNGTLRESDGPRCSNCGMNTHKSWQCPEKPNLTQGVICTACGGAGHIAKDCRQPKPGQAAANAGSNHMPLGGSSADRHKIDQEYMSLMAELGEGPPPPSSGGSSSHTPSTGNIRSLFDRPQSAPRPLLSLGPPPLSMLPRTTAPMTSNSSTTSINPWASPPASALNSGPGLLSNPPVSLGGGTAGQRGLLGPAPGAGFSGAPNSSQTPRPLMPPSSNSAPNLAQPPPGVLGAPASASAPPPPWQQTQQQQMSANSLQQQLHQQSSAQQQNTSAPPPLLQAPPPPPPPSSQQQNHHHHQQQQQQQGPPAWMNQAPPGPPGGNMGGPNMGGPPQINPWQHQPHQSGPPPGMQQQHGPPGMGCPPPGPVPPPRPVGPPPAWGWNSPQNMGPPPPGMGGGPGGPGGQQRGPNGVDLGALLSAPPPPPPS